MNDYKNSNICIKSNVYIVSTDTPFEDRSYLSKIFDKNSFEKFPRTIELTAIQKLMSELNMSCSYNKNVTPGIILEDGEYYQVIRCSKISDCMHVKRNKCNDMIKIDYKA